MREPSGKRQSKSGEASLMSLRRRRNGSIRWDKRGWLWLGGLPRSCHSLVIERSGVVLLGIFMALGDSR
jgi:hypothetical protein